MPWQVQDLPPVREMQVYDQESFAAIARDGDVYVWGSYVQPYYRLVPSPMCEPSSVHCRIVYEPLDPSLDAHLAAALHPEEVVALDDGDPPQRRSTKRAIPTRTAKTRGHFVGPGLIHDPNVGFRWADREDAIATARMNRAGAGTPDDPVVRLVFVPDSSTSTDFWCRVFRSGAVSCDIPDPFHEEPDRTPASFQLPARVRAGGHVDSGLCPLEDGRVAAWADDYDPYVPTEVAGMLSVDNDTSHSCGLRGDGSAWCWTQPRSRRRAADQTEPRKVDGIRDAVDIAVGLQFACAVLSDGHVRCWGDNEVGQLGNGTFGEPIAKACSVVAPGEPT